MPRKGYVAKRDVLPDPIYNSKLVTKLINRIMIDGKRGTAQTILYDAFADIEKKTGIIYPDSPTQTIHYNVVNNLKKVTHNHPMLSLQKTKDIEDIKDGASVKKKEDTHKMAEANKAFAHYRW